MSTRTDLEELDGDRPELTDLFRNSPRPCFLRRALRASADNPRFFFAALTLDNCDVAGGVSGGDVEGNSAGIEIQSFARFNLLIGEDSGGDKGTLGCGGGCDGSSANDTAWVVRGELINCDARKFELANCHATSTSNDAPIKNHRANAARNRKVDVCRSIGVGC